MNLEKKKEIISTIMKSEIEQNNLNISSYCFGRINFFNTSYFKKKLKSSNPYKIIQLISLPLFNGVFRPKSKELIVFYNDVSTPLFNDSIIRFLKTTYHELYHALDDTIDKAKNISYENFANQCDRFIISHSPIEMLKYVMTPQGHDSFMFEILANLYAIDKTEEYIKNNNIQCSDNEITKFNKLKNKYHTQYQNYNLTKRLNIIISEYKSCLNCKDFNKDLFELFLNENGTVKDINIIFSNETVLNLDPKILLAFIKTNTIKKAISETTLTEKTSHILNELLTNGSTELLQESENKKTI